MPKNTFNNLTQEKRNMIIDISVNEFYEYGYDKASISRIVKNAGIAKGSFYQYFENKEDIFRLVLSYASEIKVIYLKDIIIKSTQLKFFELLENLCLSSLNFIRENPKLAVITESFMRNANDKLKEAILGENSKKSNDFIEILLIRGIDEKQIKANIDIPFVASYITNLFIFMSEYVRMQNEDISKINESEYKSIVSKTIDLIAKGIGF